MRVLLFGGTAEGRQLAQWLGAEQIPATLCVATDYGAALAPNAPGLEVHAGRLDRAGMDGLIARTGCTHVVDATHPYAAQVTQTLEAAAQAAGLPYLRLVRQGADGLARPGWRTAADMEEAARILEGMAGNVLLTTGSKDLAVFARPGLVERCCPRVLPAPDSLARCLALGFPPKHIICMQGPFSRALNAAMLRQLDARALVTKDTGAPGGFAAKAEAARDTGCTLIVVARPGGETGYSMEDIQRLLKEAAGT